MRYCPPPQFAEGRNVFQQSAAVSSTLSVVIPALNEEVSIVRSLDCLVVQESID